MLTREDVLRMALEAGAADYGCTVVIGHDDLLRVMNDAYAAGQAAEREACIEDVRTIGGQFAAECEAAIRARGEKGSSLPDRLNFAGKHAVGGHSGHGGGLD